MAQKLRCAIYTRKSSEEGLEQDFNSLHAQREACEAYVKSQVGEGWIALPTAYDDGAFSGGNMERPALKTLLADVAAGRVDVVVVYKVDRLTRSLADFAKIVEIFDARGVSFVSVTQAFNTTNSMGRLTLNVLLSFAQFEREVTGERIRDKIAASKAKGMWMGGRASLGYDVQDRALVINEEEAELVRHIFRRYLQIGSVKELAAELLASGVRSKAWTTQTDKPMGGVIMGVGALHHVLNCRLYLGEIVHKDKVFPGLHKAIVSRELFDDVAAKSAARAIRRRARPSRAASGALTGLLFDEKGRRLTPSFAYGRGGKLYRYYVIANASDDELSKRDPREIRRISAPLVEGFLVGQLQGLGDCAEADARDLKTLLRRVELRSSETHLLLNVVAIFGDENPELALAAVRRRLQDGDQAIADTTDTIRVIVRRRMQLRGGRAALFGASDICTGRIDPVLVNALKRAHEDLLALKSSPFTTPEELQDCGAPPTHHGRQMAQLAFLSPELQRRLLSGRHPRGLTSKAVLKSRMPLAWADQSSWLERIARP